MKATLSRPATEEVATSTSQSSRGVSTSRRAVSETLPKVSSPAGLDSPAALVVPTPVGVAPQEPTSPATSEGPLSVGASSRGTRTAGRRAPTDTHGTDAAGPDSRSTKAVSASMEGPSSGPNSRSAGHQTSPLVGSPSGLNVPGSAATDVAVPNVGSLLDPALSLAADVLDDIERVRIANENRLRQMTRSVEDADGEERGFGLDESHPDVARLAAMVATLKAVEHDATLNLQRHMRRHPLGAWMKGQRGIGEKQGARLLAAIGDPYWRPELVYLDEDGSLIRKVPAGPRTVSALWAYSGLHVLPGDQMVLDARVERVAGGKHGNTHSAVDSQTGNGVAAKRRKGQRANWSTKAKTRAYLIAESCLKSVDTACRDEGYPHVGRGGPIRTDDHACRAAPACSCSPYRVAYDLRRRHTATTRPDWTDGHSHNDALRVASKAILRDLWRAAREWHLTNA